jgi:DnaJ domain
VSEGPQRHPLTWPASWRRTPPAARDRAAFRFYDQPLTVPQAFKQLLRELRLLEAKQLVISSNVPRGQGGEPVGKIEPPDPGVAVYFEFKGRRTSLACDSWDRAADNMGAIARHVDALRRIDRYRVGTLEQAFAGYAALTTGTASWWDVLEIRQTATLDDVDDAYSRLAKKHHPDVAGGSHEAMARLNAARDTARRELAR